MNIYLGNLNVEQIQSRTGVTFPDELLEIMKATHQQEASNTKPGMWHCYDIPFMLTCGDMGLAQKIYDYLLPMTKDFKEPLQIGVG